LGCWLDYNQAEPHYNGDRTEALFFHGFFALGEYNPAFVKPVLLTAQTLNPNLKSLSPAIPSPAAIH
jgi:hypothetical protein